MRLGRCPHGQRGLKRRLQIQIGDRGLSLPSRAAWIETSCPCRTRHRRFRRCPHGQRGLKRRLLQQFREQPRGRCPHGQRGLKPERGAGSSADVQSLPSRAAWIETLRLLRRSAPPLSLPSRAAWIETTAISIRSRACPRCRCPHGQRGLKPFGQVATYSGIASLPSRAAWIETAQCLHSRESRACRCPHGQRGLKRRAVHL